MQFRDAGPFFQKSQYFGATINVRINNFENPKLCGTNKWITNKIIKLNK